MGDFLDGQQYSLSTEAKSNKSLLFVKLTDSALHSIERYLQTKGNSLTRPVIRFKGNNGTITLPLNSQKIMYGFTLSNVETADGSSFQCIQRTGQRSFKSLGHMHMKMQVHANEDSYANTKCKMAAVEQEQKSLCTKVIKTNGSHLSCKIKKFKHPGSVFPPKITPLTKAQDQTVFLKPKDKTGNPALLQEPVRKRIIHILALKPYKKPDVLLRLIKEGISDKDKKIFPQILNQVGSLKGNMYTLSNQLWKEVEDNWKFCAKEELEVMCRRKQQFLKSSNEMQDSVSQNSIQKHVENEPVYKEPQNKKPRISHYNNNKVPDQTVKAIFSVGSAKSNKPASIKIKASIIGNSQKVPLSNQVIDHSNSIGEQNGKYSKKDPSAHLMLSRSNMMECNETCLCPIAASEEPYSKLQMLNDNHPEKY